MKLEEVRHRRLHNHNLAGGLRSTATDVLDGYGAMQAQEFAEAKWSVGQRMVDATASALEDAYAAGTILRTHMLRPTWHFVLPSDLRWIQMLTGPRVHALNAYMYRKTALDDALHTRVRGLLEEALAGGQALTRAEVAAVLTSHGIEAAGQRLAYILMHAELESVVCSGPSRGKQRTYALVEERAPSVAPLDRDESLAELTRRYFRRHGPATVRDYTWWSSLTVADAKRGLDIVGSELTRSDDGARSYWFADGQLPDAARMPTAHLLQGYDEYVIAYRESRDVFSPSRPAASGRGSSFTHAIMLDGRLIGHWRNVPGTGRCAIEVGTYEALKGRARRALEAAIDRYGCFIGAPVEVVVTGQ